jgi:hypothetical protein
MSKLIRHKWNSVPNSHKLKHKKCERCECEKFFDSNYGHLIYIDRKGHLYFRAPSCVLPNTKL